jgi:hypothetical protein
MTARVAAALAVVTALVVAFLALDRRAPDASSPPLAAHPPAVATAPSPAAAAPAPLAVTAPRAVRAPTPVPDAHIPAAPSGAAAEAPASEPLELAAVDAPEPVRRATTGAIRGKLRSADGRPLAAVPVVALAADGGDAAEDVTDADGRFFLVALRPGRYAVFAGLGSTIAGRVGARGADVVAGGVTPVALAERTAGVTVRVHAVDATGHTAPAQALLVPAAGEAPSALGGLLASEAILLPGAAQTVVEAVPPGRYTVVLLQGERAVRTAPLPVEVAQGDLDVEVRLPVAVSAL